MAAHEFLHYNSTQSQYLVLTSMLKATVWQHVGVPGEVTNHGQLGEFVGGTRCLSPSVCLQFSGPLTCPPSIYKFCISAYSVIGRLAKSANGLGTDGWHSEIYIHMFIFLEQIQVLVAQLG